MSTDAFEHPAWHARASFLPLLGAVLGLAFHFLVGEGDQPFNWTDHPWRIAAGSLVAVGGISFALTVEELRWQWSAAFALIAGIVAGAIFYWNGSPGGYASDEWQLIAVLVAIAIAAPLFQAARDKGGWNRDPAAIHLYAWNNVVLWFAAWGFVLATFLLALLLAELFNLIGIDLLRDLMRKGWFDWMLVGGALGGAIAMLRDQDRIMGLLQRVVMTVLSVLAPALAAGLALFVLALPFTGLEPLWDRTSATTPTLLACVIGAVLLANAVIGNDAEEESRSRLLRSSALVLCLVMPPLAAVALVSTWLRIDQYGFTPERLWGLVFVGVTLIVSAAYLLSVLMGRSGWMATLRTVNVSLAGFICALAVLLATPLSDFGGISTRDQVARLRSGEVTPERFDWAALAFDFGPSGRETLRDLAQEGSSTLIRARARRALAANARWDLSPNPHLDVTSDAPAPILVVRPESASLPGALRSAVTDRGANPGVCAAAGTCTIFWSPGDTIAVAISDTCPTGRSGQGDARCPLVWAVMREAGGAWVNESGIEPEVQSVEAIREREERLREAVRRGDVEVRSVTRRQLFIGGEPAGLPFE